MYDQPALLIAIATAASALPVAIWLYFIFSKKTKSKKTIALIFALGCLTAPALLGLQYLWNIFPQFNLAAFIENSISDQSTMFIATFVLFGAMEEIIKMVVVAQIDKRTLLISNLNDAVRYSMASALGFSFIENIYYLYQFWPSLTTGAVLGMYVFRSIFTTGTHMIFSGIFGHFYGVGKFSIQITKQQEITGKSHPISSVIAKIFNLPLSQAHQQRLITKGLFLAIVLHAIQNFLLQYNNTLPVMLFAVGGFLYFQYLLSRKTGHLILDTDITGSKKSTMAKKDEEVVLELVGMWFKERKFVDVIHICERLLERDPDNKVVQMFRAQALDKLDDKDPYKKALNTVLNNKDQSKLTKYMDSQTPVENSKDEELEKRKLKKKDVDIKQLNDDGTFKIQ